MLGSLSLAGCGSADGGDAIAFDTLPSGAVVVTNPATGAWGESEGWTLVEDLRIGRLDGDGPDVFGSVAGLAVDGEGRMYVLDQQASEVRVFSRDGAHLRTLGREGSGPGEFRRPSGLAIAPDGRIWVLDAGNGRFVVFDEDGSVSGTHRRASNFTMLPWPGGFDREGRLHDVATATRPGGSSSEVVLVRFDAAVEPADTFWLPAYEPRQLRVLNAAGLPMMSISMPFYPRMQWRFDPRGHVWSGINETYEVVRLGVAGDTTRVIRMNHTPWPVTTAEADSARSMMREMIAGAGQGTRAEDEVRIPAVKPAYGAFWVDAEGYLWVTPTKAEDAGGAMPFDVFDVEGRYLGPVDPGVELATYPAPVLTRDAVYAVWRDELDVAYVVRLRIEGRRR